MKIVTYGAESTGKTSLAKALADHYDTVWVPEYARNYLQDKYDQSGGICAYNDLMPIAQGQLQCEHEKAKDARAGLLFCDTNPLQTYYYGKAYFDDFEHPQLWDLVMAQEYDFYFLTYIDIPWEADDLRDKPQERHTMHRLFKHSLEEHHLPFKLLKGNLEERLKQATKKVDELLATNKCKK